MWNQYFITLTSQKLALVEPIQQKIKLPLPNIPSIGQQVQISNLRFMSVIFYFSTK